MMTERPPAIDADTAAADLGRSTVLLDVREYEEWMSGRAPAAINIPMSQIASRVAEIDRTKRVICACRSGNRSARVTSWLRTQSIDAVNLAGGMAAWAAAGHPLVNHAGNPGIVI
jgi:rhodanese-related sulfurtransferase